MARKGGSHPRADVQESDTKQCRSGRAGMIPRSSCGRRSGVVDPAVAWRRIAFVPGEIRGTLQDA